MQIIKTIVRPHKVVEVQDALSKLPVSGMTVTEVMGRGERPPAENVYRGLKYAVAFEPAIQLELVVSDEIVDDAIHAIIASARTGMPGDGMVFVSRVTDSYRIRTGDWEG